MEFPVIGDGKKYHTVSEAVVDGCNSVEIVGDTVEVAINVDRINCRPIYRSEHE